MGKEEEEKRKKKRGGRKERQHRNNKGILPILNLEVIFRPEVMSDKMEEEVESLLPLLPLEAEGMESEEDESELGVASEDEGRGFLTNDEDELGDDFEGDVNHYSM